ncbi:TlpA disulfide reductase family protein [uncultured Flavobacterium sp.]|uniref:TlpA family protein disulfide reductase n=1 Tax=uncultured Flavobacterium sp. TaxID=165435 RepID=UPI0030EF512A|tara:strand:- start:14765 stop:15703 length:939 start_codon:yes stop_codon:yes gene_type:complete
MKDLKLKCIVFFIITFFSTLTINAQDAKLQKEIINKLNEVHKPTFKTRDSLASIYKVIYEKISYTSDTVIKNNLLKKIEELEILSDRNADKELDNEFGFIRQFPSNQISLDVLHYKVTKREATDKYEAFNALYNALAFNLQNSSKGLQLKEQLVNFKNSNIGSDAPDFVVKDIRNTTLSLASFKNNKYVLLTFGNTTSQSCIDENVYLKEVFQKYNQNGLEVINVAIDDNMEVLRKSIEVQKIEVFKNIPLISNEVPLLENYFVYSIPQKILIDKNGVIIGRWRGSNNTTKKELNLVLSNLFKVVASSNTVH